jgi:hypothetical protein
VHCNTKGAWFGYGARFLIRRLRVVGTLRQERCNVQNQVRFRPKAQECLCAWLSLQVLADLLVTCVGLASMHVNSVSHRA